VGLATAGGLAERAAGVLGTAATWVASTAGSRAAGREAETTLGRACERQARVCAAWPAVKSPPKSFSAYGLALLQA
jgi:hypothetical protein